MVLEEKFLTSTSVVVLDIFYWIYIVEFFNSVVELVGLLAAVWG